MSCEGKRHEISLETSLVYLPIYNSPSPWLWKWHSWLEMLSNTHHHFWWLLVSSSYDEFPKCSFIKYSWHHATHEKFSLKKKRTFSFASNQCFLIFPQNNHLSFLLDKLMENGSFLILKFFAFRFCKWFISKIKCLPPFESCLMEFLQKFNKLRATKGNW